MAIRYVSGAEWHSRPGSRWESTICGLYVEVYRLSNGSWCAYLGKPNGHAPGPSYLCAAAGLRDAQVRAADCVYNFAKALDLSIGGLR